ncbi:MAG: rubrerythrin family protein [Thermincolia bacterium]
MNTEKNLKTAFAGESQANQKYLAFAQKAEEEGYKGIAKLFRATAEAETLHAMSHLKVLGLINSTEENLKAAIEGETYEFTEMYPGFIAEAVEENNAAAKRTFHLANEAEKIHAELYKKALENLNHDADYFLCGICGYVNENSAPEKCPVCGAPSARFKNIG